MNPLMSVSDAQLQAWTSGEPIPDGRWLIDRPVSLSASLRGGGNRTELVFTQNGGLRASGDCAQVEVSALSIVASELRVKPIIEANTCDLRLSRVALRWEGELDTAYHHPPALALGMANLTLIDVNFLCWPGDFGAASCVIMGGPGSRLDAVGCLFAPWKSVAIAARGCKDISLRRCSFAMNIGLAAVKLEAALTSHTEVALTSTSLSGQVDGALLGLVPSTHFNLKVDGCHLGQGDIIPHLAVRTLEQRHMLMATSVPDDVWIDGRPLIDHLHERATPYEVTQWSFAVSSSFDDVVSTAIRSSSDL